MCCINSQAGCPFVFCCCIVPWDVFEPAICWCWLFLCECNTEVCIHGFVYFFQYVWHLQCCLANNMLCFFFSVISLWNFILRFSTLFCLGSLFLNFMLDSGYPRNVSHSGQIGSIPREKTMSFVQRFIIRNSATVLHLNQNLSSAMWFGQCYVSSKLQPLTVNFCSIIFTYFCFVIRYNLFLLSSTSCRDRDKLRNKRTRSGWNYTKSIATLLFV